MELPNTVRQMNGRKLNWIPDLPDTRDRLYKFMSPEDVEDLPEAIDLRPYMPPIVDQLNIGSCTANAFAGNLGYLQEIELKKTGIQPHEYDLSAFTPVSRLFIYYNERLLIGMEWQDSGSSLRDGIKTLATQGACSEDEWAYDPGLIYTKPAPSAYAQALSYKITQYLSITNLYQMKHCLADGFPFVFGFTMYESFANVSVDGIVTMPQTNERVNGGHAVCAVGYDDAHKIFVIRNSWGNSWGDEGYFYMPYEYIESSLADDFWTIRA